MEKLANDQWTSLAVDLPSGTGVGGTISLSSAVSITVNSRVRCRVGDELILADVASSTSLTIVERGAEGTTASTHPATRRIAIGILTVAGLDAITAAGRTLVVDAINGSDTFGVRGTTTKPFATPAAAQTAAVSGDVIQVRPESHTVTANLAKAGVNWNLQPGVTLSRSDSTLTGLFDDGGAAMTFALIGAGVLYRTHSVNGQFLGCVKVAHASSDVSIRARAIRASAGSASAATGAVVQLDGKLYVEADYIGSIDAQASIGQRYGVWWSNGSMFVRAGRIENRDDSCLYADCDNVPTGDMNVQADEILGLRVLEVLGTNSTAAIWVRTLVARSTSGALLQYQGSNRVYLEAQKLFGRCFLQTTAAGLVYVRAQKHSAIADGSAGSPNILEVTSGGTGTLLYEVSEVDPAGFTGDMLKIAGGTLTEIRGMRYTANSGSLGLEVTGGTVRLVDCRIDTQANSSTNPLTVSGGTVELVNCTLLAHSSRNAIEASSAQTVLVKGTLAANRPLHANVALSHTPLRDQVYEGTVTIRQSAGVAGTDDVTLTHDGDRAILRSYSGATRVVAPDGIGLEIWEPSGTRYAQLAGSAGTPFLYLYDGGGLVQYFQKNVVGLPVAAKVGWEAVASGLSGALDTDLTRGAAGQVKPGNGAGGAGSFLLGEISDPAAPAANNGVLYIRDNGAGKTQLVVRFPTGAVQVIATEP